MDRIELPNILFYPYVTQIRSVPRVISCAKFLVGNAWKRLEAPIWSNNSNSCERVIFRLGKLFFEYECEVLGAKVRVSRICQTTPNEKNKLDTTRMNSRSPQAMK